MPKQPRHSTWLLQFDGFLEPQKDGLHLGPDTVLTVTLASGKEIIFCARERCWTETNRLNFEHADDHHRTRTVIDVKAIVAATARLSFGEENDEEDFGRS